MTEFEDNKHNRIQRVMDARNLLSEVRYETECDFRRHSLLWKSLEAAILSAETAWALIEEEHPPPDEDF